jgi:RimJ/RimL family protein N-acetyltransferase
MTMLSLGYGGLPPVLETERLRLRGHRVEDFDAFAAMWAEPKVTEFIGGRAYTNEESWLRLLRQVGHWPLMGYGYWVVEEKATGEFLGETGYAEFQREIEPSIVGVPEAGWVFCARAHGKGYAAEAIGAVMAWGDTHFGVPRTVCLIDPGNTASLRVAAKMGFVEERRTVFRGHETLLLGRATR